MRGRLDGDEFDEPLAIETQIVLGADKRRFGVSEFDFGAQDVEFGDGAGIEAVLDVFELLREKFHGLFANRDEFRIEKGLVKGLADGEDGVGDGALEAEQGVPVAEFGGANTGRDAATGIEQLSHFDLRAPGVFLIFEFDGDWCGRCAGVTKRKFFDRIGIDLRVGAGRCEMREDVRTCLNKQAVSAAKFLLGFENGRVLFQREVEALGECQFVALGGGDACGEQHTGNDAANHE